MTTAHPPKQRALWTFVITSVAGFIAMLDNLVVTTALPVIKEHLHTSLSGLEWTVNGYTLTFAVLLVTAAALGDLVGRKRIFTIGISVFTAGSLVAALAPSVGVLIAARAVQGLGGAMVMPLSLTLLSAAVPAGRRGLALGAWGGIGGLAIAMGPLIGGAIVDAGSWQWIFLVNVPIGVVLVPLAMRYLTESHGPSKQLDVPGVLLASSGLFGIVLGLVRANTHGWLSTSVLASFVGGMLLTLAFIVWETRAAHPMVPLSFFRSRTFSAANIASMLMSFGMFGSVFLLAQFFQVVQHISPFGSGLRILPWTCMPIVVAPIAGALSDRVGGGRLIALGLTLQAAGLAWLAAVIAVHAPYSDVVIPFILSGAGMGLFFAPVANVVLSDVRPEQEGQASGVNAAVRELGGVFGVSVLSSVFAHHGGAYGSPHAYVHGLDLAVVVGAAVVAVGAVAAATIRRAAARPAPASDYGDAAGRQHHLPRGQHAGAH